MSKVSNITKIYLFSSAYMLLVLLPIMVPFLEGYGLTMAEIFQLQGVFAMSVLLCEVPSGYIADHWGKKRCLMVGGILNGLGYSWLLFADSFWDFVAFELMVGAAASMYSGADVALLYDSAKEELQDQVDTKKLVGGLMASRSFAEAGAAVINSLILIFASFEAVLNTQVLIGWLPFLIALTITDVHEKPIVHSHFENFMSILRRLFLDSKMLRYISLNMILWGMATFYAVWLFQKYWEIQEVPLSLFGWLWASYNATVAVSAKLAHKVEAKLGTKQLLFLTGLLPIVGYLGLAFGVGFVGVAFGLLFQIGRGFHQVLFKDALNARVESEHRATANSVISFGFRGTFFLTGPAVGLLVDRIGLDSTLMILAGVFSMLFVILFLPVIREVQEA